jgi:hypothetical protein
MVRYKFVSLLVWLVSYVARLIVWYKDRNVVIFELFGSRTGESIGFDYTPIPENMHCFMRQGN